MLSLNYQNEIHANSPKNTLVDITTFPVRKSVEFDSPEISREKLFLPLETFELPKVAENYLSNSLLTPPAIHDLVS